MTQTIELPDGNSAEIRSQSEVTERERREIARANFRTLAVVDKLKQLGYDPSKPDVAFQFSDLDNDELNVYIETVICTFTVTVTPINRKPTRSDLLDMPMNVFGELAMACMKVYQPEDETEEKPADAFGVNGIESPLAPTAESSD